MKNHKQLIAFFTLLFLGARLCVAQQEDTLRLRAPGVKPQLIIPNQPMQSKQSLMPSKLRLDGLDYNPTPPTLPAEDTIVPDLTVDNFTKFYYKGFLKWEKDTYGVHLDIQPFMMKNGKYISRHAFIPGMDKKSPFEKEREAPYPLHPGIQTPVVGLSTPIEWKPTKHDIWFKKNFSWESRALQIMGSRVDSLGGRSIEEAKNLRLVDSIINKTGKIPQISIAPINYKRRIKQIKKDIKEKAKFDLK